ncbi:MAG TPA: hypothetical protein VES20_04875 [Bryobacteraceae bacterium]|nr:hypothetical protein [Bryobacteraceae bacterium]
MARMFRYITCVLVAATALLAADVDGKWKGSALRSDGSKETEVYFELKSDGAKVSGVAGETDVETVPIVNGKLDGGNVQFEVIANEARYNVTLTAEGDTMKGSATRTADGQTSAPVKLELKRVTQ